MPWVKLDDAFFTDEAAMAAGPDGRLLFLAGLCHASRNLTDGSIDKRALPSIAALAGADIAAADTLVDLGLWVDDGPSYRAPRYLDFNPSAETVRANRDAAAKRMAAKRSDEVRANTGRSSPTPVPVPSPMTSSSSSSATETGLPPGLWKKVAEKKAKASTKPIGNLTGWLKATADNERDAHEDRAVWLWTEFQISESQLVDVILAGGSSPLLNSLPRRAA